MSISSEITRISGNVSDALTSIAAKGVTVPSGSNSDDLADLIDLISVDSTYSITKSLTSVTSSADDTKVIAGNSFFTELTPASGYVISSITVTMGGVDITDQVFKPGTGAKTITTNGTYAATADNLSGYTAVSVNVPSGSATLGTKTITTNGTYYASNDNLDGYSQVSVNVQSGITPTGTKNISITSNGTTTEDVTNYASASITANVPNTYTSSDEGKVVSNGALVAQTSDTVTTNGTVDTTLINSLTVSVPTGGSTKLVQGTFTTNSSSGAQTVTISYSGSGYPVAACVYIDGGMRSNSTFNSLINRYTIGQSTLVKAYTGTAPTYGTSGDANVGIHTYVYKNSTSSADTYGANGNTTANSFSSSNASSTAATTLRFKSNTSMSIYVKGSSNYGYAPSTKYHYDIIYSA